MKNFIKFYTWRAVGLVFILILLPNCSFGQSISTSELEESRQTRYLSIISQNDLYQYWQQSDRYYTNGLHFEYADKLFDNGFARAILLKGLKDAKSEYALSLGQDMYTPNDITISYVDSTDRPYCGHLYFTFTRHSNEIEKGRKFTTKLYLGVQGQTSGAAESQIGFHELIGDQKPNGWPKQIANGLILDYEINHQRMLPIKARHLEVHTNALARVGTIYNYVQAGLGMKFGLFNYSYANFNGLFNSFSKKGEYLIEDIRWSQKKKSKNPSNKRSRIKAINRDFQIYGFIDLNAMYMFYNGSAQGSLVNFDESPYLYKRNVLDPARGSLVSGITINYKNTLIQYQNITLEDVFKGEGRLFGWGQISITASF